MHSGPRSGHSATCEDFIVVASSVSAAIHIPAGNGATAAATSKPARSFIVVLDPPTGRLGLLHAAQAPPMTAGEIESTTPHAAIANRCFTVLLSRWPRRSSEGLRR